MDHSFASSEIGSQPSCWRRVPAVLASVEPRLPRPGERVAVIGCGTSWFMAMAYAALREAAGHGITDAWTPDALPLTRGYERIVAISRSGTTTEGLDVLARARGHTPTVAISAVPALALLRASLGEDVERLATDAEAALAMPLDGLRDAAQFTFLGAGWTNGLANEAAWTRWHICSSPSGSRSPLRAGADSTRTGRAT